MPSQGKEVWGMGKDARPLFTLKERRNDPMAGANESKANGADVASIAAAATDNELSVAEYKPLLGMEQPGMSVSSPGDLQNTQGSLCEFPVDKGEHCLQDNILVVTDGKPGTLRYLKGWSRRSETVSSGALCQRQNSHSVLRTVISVS